MVPPTRVTQIAIFIFALVEGHVKFFFSDTADVNPEDLEGRPIRNAPGRQSDGVMSTSGPCGTNSAWGANGYSFAEEGDEITMVINYNGGHKSDDNVFRGVWACDDDGSEVPQTLLEGQNDPTPVTDCTQSPCEPACTVLRCPDGETQGQRCGAPDGNDFEEGYVFRCTVPDGSAGKNCSMAVMDQRDWGGCYDLVVKENVVVPINNNPVTVIDTSLQGSYKVETSSTIINNAPEGETCCTLTFGQFTVFETDDSGMQIMSEIRASCNGESFVHSSVADLTKDALGPVWRADLVMGVTGNEQEYELSLSEGLLLITQLDPTVPQFCDFVVMKSTDNSASRLGLSFLTMILTISSVSLVFY